MFVASKGHEGDVAETAGEKEELGLHAWPRWAQTGGWGGGKREAQSME